jgi:hypothetical protein
VTPADIRAKSRELYQEEGTLEIEDDAEVSPCPGGHYVAAWVWVPAEVETA